MTYDIRQRRQLIAQRRRKLPPAPPKLDGIFVVDHVTHTETYLDFDLLHQIAKDIMHPMNARAVEEELGKVDWKDAPTYNMRRKR